MRTTAAPVSLLNFDLMNFLKTFLIIATIDVKIPHV